MKRLKGKEEKNAMVYLEKAGVIAKTSTCFRAHCGAVIVKNNEIIGSGANSPPKNKESQRRCHRKKELPKDFKITTFHLHPIEKDDNRKKTTIAYTRSTQKT